MSSPLKKHTHIVVLIMADSNSTPIKFDCTPLTEDISPYRPDPDLPDSVDSDGHFGLAVLLEEQGTSSATERAFHIYSYLASKQQHVDSMHRLGILYRIGVSGLFPARPLDAMIMFELVLSHQPGNVRALEDLVDVVHHGFGRDERAKGLYRKILRIEPDHAKAKLGLATVLGHDSPRAKQLLMEVIEKEGHTQGRGAKREREGKQKDEAVGLLAQFLYLDGQDDEAEELLQGYGVENGPMGRERKDGQRMGIIGLCKRLRAVDLDCRLTEEEVKDKNKGMPKTGMDAT